MFFFGHLTPNGTLPASFPLPLEVLSTLIFSLVEDLRYNHQYHPVPLEQTSPALAVVFDVIAQGRFGDGSIYEPFLNTIRTGDYYLVSDDFDSCGLLSITPLYRLLTPLPDLEAQRLVDTAYQDKASWIKKSITTTARMGKFSSDRAILNYAEVRNCWILAPGPIMTDHAPDDHL